MNRDFTKRDFRPVFRYGAGEDKGSGAVMSPFCAGEKGPTFKLPLPATPTLGAGSSRAITASDGPETMPWRSPASGVVAPNKK